MRVAELSIFLFDLGEAILPSRPQFDCAAVSSGGQGWPPLGGHPKGLSLTVASTVAGFVTRGRTRSSLHRPSKTVLSASSKSVILLTCTLRRLLAASFHPERPSGSSDAQAQPRLPVWDVETGKGRRLDHRRQLERLRLQDRAAR